MPLFVCLIPRTVGAWDGVMLAMLKLVSVVALGLFMAGALANLCTAEETQTTDQATATGQIVITTSRADLIGTADSASQGEVTQQELTLRPVYRVGQLMETVPGLVVTVHSGEGKANQYLLRGENLDHGIDFADFIDDMPINRPSNAHGQGYSDLNFVLPQLLGGLSYTKGPYYADIGDFGAVGSAHMRLLDDLPNQVSTSIGTLGDEDVFGGGTAHFDDGSRLLGAVDLSHIDGPYDHPENYRKIDLATRYSKGTDLDGYSVMAMVYKGQGRNNTDQPLRAIEDGLIGRYGTLDPSDGSRSERLSLSGHYGVEGDDWSLATNAYVIHSMMVLWNDFTHFLNDPVNGDQEQQDETRTTLGGGIAFTKMLSVAGIQSDTVIGLQDRYDSVYVDRRHTANRVVLPYCNDGNGDYSIGLYACAADQIQLNDIAPYVSNTTHWLPWLRSTIGARQDFSWASDRSEIAGIARGTASQGLFQPKGNIAFGPWFDTEFYISAGKGFHSDDIRGVLGSVPLEGTPLSVGRVPLMAKTSGAEVGFRNRSIPGLDIQFAAFRQDFSSELIYDQDAGQDQATAPSRRQGFELSAQYHPAPWIELSGDFAASHARYFKNAATLADLYGITGGTFIANSPDYIASFGALVDHLGPWFGGLEERILGPYPLTDGPNSPRAAGYKETNLDIGYRFSESCTAKLAIYNLLNTKAYSAEYYYATTITPREVARYGTTGVSDYQVHPLEPLSARFTVSVTF